jgi:hypothetical protein
MSGASAISGASATVETTSSWPRPSGSANRSVPPAVRAVAVPFAASRCSQKSIASG